MGIRHLVSKDIQVEPQGEGTDDMDTKTIYHYTFGLTPKPPYPGARGWRLDKRMFYGAYPSDHLDMPPVCTAKSGFIIASMWNEAAQAIPGWKTKHPSPAAAGESAPESLMTKLYQQTTPEAADGLGALLRGSGPWRWGKLTRAFFYARGIFYVAANDPVSKGPLGTWKVSASDPTSATVTFCGAVYTLRFASASAPWSFTATDGSGASTSGSLGDEKQHVPSMLSGVAAERLRPAPAGAAGTAELVNEIAGSGPWIWAGSGPLSFMRGGVLQTPWGTGTWGVSRAGGETAPADAVFADFAGSQHTVRMHVPECLRMQSRRKADDDVVGINFIGNGASVAASAGNEGACLDSTVAAP